MDSMRVSGVTIGYNAVSAGYPIVQSIRSMLPIVDEVVANIGRSDDGTREAVLGIGSDRIRLLEDPWDMSVRTGGLVLSQETNRAMKACTGDWILYIQADEVLHEADYARLRHDLERCDRIGGIDGISFRYIHFYGSPHFAQDHRWRWYTRAVRAVRNRAGIVSVGDALKFRRMEALRPRRIREYRSAVRVFHYGWARPPEVMLRKQRQFALFYHDDSTINRTFTSADMAVLYPHMGNLVRFSGTHPAVMRDYVAGNDWKFDGRIGAQWPVPFRKAWIWSGYLVWRAARKLWGMLIRRPSKA